MDIEEGRTIKTYIMRTLFEQRSNAFEQSKILTKEWGDRKRGKHTVSFFVSYIKMDRSDPLKSLPYLWQAGLVQYQHGRGLGSLSAG
jgi:hypothetical protein